MSANVYRPLKDGEIRLFELSPGNFHDPLTGRLAHHFIDSGVPSYAALSYVWGEEISATGLVVLPNNSKCMTSNLACALRYLRRPESEVLLWVDSLCINQDDNVEKAQQVSRMRDVFAMASEVVAFLGDEHCDGTGDLNLAARFAEGRGADKSIRCPILVDVMDYLRSGGGNSPWRGLFGVLRRPWFSRIWVVQEALVARKLSFRCGVTSISALKLAHIVSQIDAGEDGSYMDSITERENWKAVFSSLELIRKIASRELVAVHTKQKADLLGLLWFYRGFKATRTRDHLFALLGLANASFHPLLDPDYQSSLEIIVSRYACYFVRFHRDPIRLLYCAGGISAQNRFPSWIPDWTLDEEDYLASHLVVRRFVEPPEGSYKTALSRSSSMRTGKTDNVLIVTGSIFSHLIMIGDNHWDNDDGIEGRFDGHLDYMHESDHFVQRMSTYPTGEEPKNVQVELLVGNRVLAPGYGYTELPDHYVKQYDRWRRALEDGQRVSRGLRGRSLTQKGASTNKHYINALFEVRNVRLCLTKNGYLGLVPLAAELGDVVCIVHGSCVPFILRRCKDVKGAFRLVGKCYIHGIMEGEAMRMKDLEQREISLV
jgi:hypothetical protein